MVCRDCGFAFFPAESESSDDKMVVCPKCSSVMSLKTVDVFDSNYREYSSGVANILRTIAYITWISGIIGLILVFLICKSITTALVIEVIKSGYLVFISGMMFYAFGEIVQLLTDIRNDQGKRQ